METTEIKKGKFGVNVKGEPVLFLDEEPQKTFYIQNNIGKVKYVVNVSDGVTKNRDGSPFTGIATFSNKKEMAKYLTKIKKEGYVEI